MPSWPALLVAMTKRERAHDAADHTQVPLSYTRRFAVIWITAVLGSLVVTSSLLIAEFGWHTFWHRVGTPHIDPGANDLLIATVIGSVGIFLALWFSSVVAIAAFEQSANLRHVAYRLSTLWTFVPILYYCSTINFLLAAAWGVGRSWVGLLFMPVAGTFALYCIVRMTGVALSPVPEDRRLNRGGT